MPRIITTLTLAASFAFLLILTSSARAQEKEPAKVFLLAGQSNMTGSAKSSALTDEHRAAMKKVMIWEPGSWYKRFPKGDPKRAEGQFWMSSWMPLNENLAMRKKGHKDGFGPEAGFATEIVKAFPNDKIYIVKTAWGGQSQGRWKPSTEDEVTKYRGWAWVMFDKNVTAALKELKDYEICGMVWLQGESDSIYPQSASKYEANCKHLFKTIREKVKTPEMPIIIGRLHKDLPKSKKYKWPLAPKTRAAQEKIADDDPNVYIFSTDEFPLKSDITHFDAEGQQKVGRKAGEMMVEILKKN